jgi:hypothetical protein
MFRKTFLMLVAALLLSACANRLTPPPSCDGSDRRPVNTGKWPSAIQADFGCS